MKYIAIDTNGNIVRIKEHPRKELMEYHGVKHAARMYQEVARGKDIFRGYIVAGHWYSVYGIEGVKFAKEVTWTG